MATEKQTSKVILRFKDVKSRIGLSRTTVRDMMKAGSFPAAISLGSNSVGWLQHEIDEWVEKRVAVSRGAKLQ